MLSSASGRTARAMREHACIFSAVHASPDAYAFRLTPSWCMPSLLSGARVACLHYMSILPCVLLLAVLRRPALPPSSSTVLAALPTCGTVDLRLRSPSFLLRSPPRLAVACGFGLGRSPRQGDSLSLADAQGRRAPSPRCSANSKPHRIWYSGGVVSSVLRRDVVRSSIGFSR